MSRIFIALAVSALIIVPAYAAASTTAPSSALPFTIGPDTTFFKGPLLPDGSVDYVAAINAQDSQGITPQSNAASLLVQIVDPDVNGPEQQRQRSKALRALGLGDVLPDEIKWNRLNTNGGENARIRSATERPWKADDIPELSAFLKSNEKALDVVDRASRRTRFWLPVTNQPDAEDSLLKEYGSTQILMWRNIGDAILARSMLKLGKSDPAGAVDDAMIVQRLASLLGQSADQLTYTIAPLLRDEACRSLWSIFQEARMSAEQFQKLSSDLASLEPIPSPLHVIQHCRFEYLHAVQTLCVSTKQLETMKPQLSAAGVPVPDWNRILRTGNKFYDDCALACSLSSDDPGSAQAWKAIKDEIAHFVDIAHKANYSDESSGSWAFPKPGESSDVYSDRISGIMLAITVQLFEEPIQRSIRINTKYQWTAEVGPALARYRFEHGNYPATMDDLIPKYLPALPAHSAKSKIVYERSGEGYVIRYNVAYPPQQVTNLAQEHHNYFWSDIIIRTDPTPW